MGRVAPAGLLRAEYYWLLFLCFVLPILEAPKSIALGVLLILLLVRLIANLDKIANAELAGQGG